MGFQRGLPLWPNEVGRWTQLLKRLSNGGGESLGETDADADAEPLPGCALPVAFLHRTPV